MRLAQVSIVIPCRNEAHFIETCVQAILDQEQLESVLEIIVADGMSTDGTRRILEELARKHPLVRFLDNPERIVSTGLNRAIALARGDIVIRIDGHAEVARDFIRSNLEVLDVHPEAWSVGGPIVHEARTKMGKAIALAMCHPFGVGNAKHRFRDYNGYAEGAAFPAIRKWVFDKIGNFDEKLVRNQDDEFNYRMRQAGGCVFVSPKIKYRYFVRERLANVFRQYFQYAFWRVAVIRKHGQATALRQWVPSLFFGLCLALLSAGLLLKEPLLAVTLPWLYLVVLCFAGLWSALRHGMGTAWRLPLAIATIHIAYAAGFFRGSWASIFKPDAWPRVSAMSELSR